MVSKGQLVGLDGCFIFNILTLEVGWLHLDILM